MITSSIINFIPVREEIFPEIINNSIINSNYFHPPQNLQEKRKKKKNYRSITVSLKSTFFEPLKFPPCVMHSYIHPPSPPTCCYRMHLLKNEENELPGTVWKNNATAAASDRYERQVRDPHSDYSRLTGWTLEEEEYGYRYITGQNPTISRCWAMNYSRRGGNGRMSKLCSRQTASSPLSSPILLKCIFSMADRPSFRIVNRHYRYTAFYIYI